MGRSRREFLARTSLGVLGDVCAVDRMSEALPTRILEVRTSPDAWLETPAELVSTVAFQEELVLVTAQRWTSLAALRAGTHRRRYALCRSGAGGRGLRSRAFIR